MAVIARWRLVARGMIEAGWIGNGGRKVKGMISEKVTRS